jgi:hypothetical protein
MPGNLISIPRVESRAPNKNTIEWEIPGNATVGLMLIERVGYTFLAKVEVKKQHWWSSSRKTFTASSPNVMEVIIKGLNFLEQHGYYIDHNTIKLGETVGFGTK